MAKTEQISLDNPLVRTYMAHSALMVVELLFLSPIAAMTWINKGIFSSPDIVRRAYLSELKSLAPFWIIGALYTTTNSPVNMSIKLFRIFSIARLIVITGFIEFPVHPIFTDIASAASFWITMFMGIKVVCTYWRAL